MDQEFEHRWRTGSHPFDGVILRLPDMLPLDVLRRVLLRVVSDLQQGQTDTQLYTLYDWHEHDGIMTAPRLTPWEKPTTLPSSDATLFAARSGDTYVRVAFFTEERDFYLRFYIPDQYDLPDDRTGLWGEFDLTGSQALVDRIQVVAEQSGAVGVTQEPANSYFDRTYSG